MNTYHVSIVLTETALLDFLDKNRIINVVIQTIAPDQAEEAPPVTAAAYARQHGLNPRQYRKKLRAKSTAPRKKRGSKVVETIINELGKGPAGAGQLKSVLREAGMSEHSLSTGLQILQKSGQIKRANNGEYYLATQEAAAE